MTTRLGVSVVIPHRNAGLRLSEAVSSVLHMTLQIPHEIIVVDDCSDDQESQHALDLLACTARVIRLEQQRGAQHCRNIGIEQAHLPLVLPLDADDRLAGRHAGLAYPEIASALLADKATAFVHTASMMFDAFSGLTIGSYPLCEEMVARKHHVPTSIVYRREEALNAGGYNPAIVKWQDWSFAVGLLAARRAQGLPNEIQYVAAPGHEYRVHSRPGRLSAMATDELAEVRKSVRAHGEFFREVLGVVEEDDDVLAARVYAHKPDRLDDILFMATFDFEQARKVARERDGYLQGTHDQLGFP